MDPFVLLYVPVAMVAAVVGAVWRWITGQR